MFTTTGFTNVRQTVENCGHYVTLNMFDGRGANQAVGTNQAEGNQMNLPNVNKFYIGYYHGLFLILGNFKRT